MMWRTWNLGRVRGVAVMVDASALILVLYLGLRSLDQFRTYFDGGQLGLLVLVIVVGYLASIVLHEVGHVVAGRMFAGYDHSAPLRAQKGHLLCPPNVLSQLSTSSDPSWWGRPAPIPPAPSAWV